VVLCTLNLFVVLKGSSSMAEIQCWHAEEFIDSFFERECSLFINMMDDLFLSFLQEILPF